MAEDNNEGQEEQEDLTESEEAESQAEELLEEAEEELESAEEETEEAQSELERAEEDVEELPKDYDEDDEEEADEVEEEEVEEEEIVLVSKEKPVKSGEDMRCTSCNLHISAAKNFVTFPCPSCGKELIVRCDVCKSGDVKYVCPQCNFEGP